MILGQLIGSGRRCDVYACGECRVVKLFQPGAPLDWIEGEAKRSRLIYEAGLPVPWIGDTIDLDGRKGIVYERLDGLTLSQALRESPGSAPALMEKMAELHYSIHRHRIEGLPSQRERLSRGIGRTTLLTGDLRERVLCHLAALPDGDFACHGDLNTDNVIITSGGWKVIDWDNACFGNPLADVARTVIMLDGSVNYIADLDEREVFMRLERQARDAYLHRYADLSGAPVDDVIAWTAPVAANRLSEGITEEDAWLLETVERALLPGGTPFLAS